MSTPTRLFEYIYNQRANNPLQKCMAKRDPNGQWIYYSTEDVIRMAEQTAAGLLALGLQRGEKVAIVAYKNRPEWAITDMGVQMAGGVSVPLYPTISSGEYEFILNNAEARFAFCGSGDLYDKLLHAQPQVSSLEKIYTFDQEEGRLHWESIYTTEGLEEIEKIKASINPEDLVTLIYTSGTTGKPKGVMLSHTNINHVVKETAFMLPDSVGAPILSFLPLCHIYERANSYGYINKAVSIHFTGTDNLGGDGGDLKSVQPVFFATVPRLLEKVYEAIYNRGLQLSGTAKRIFFWALSLTEGYDIHKKMSPIQKMKMSIADRIIFSKWREAVGGNLKLVVTGAAPCPTKILQVFNAAGIPVREGYGLTETSPTLTVNHLDINGAMIGSVGPAIHGTELMIDASEGDYRAGEGEILAKGPSIMQGYYKNPEATEGAFKEINGERWFRTGDIGTLVQGPGGNEFLRITDRKKELLKTSGGKYVAPAPIENRMKEDFLIEQVMVVGDKKKFVSALIVPAETALKNWMETQNMEWKGLEDAIINPEVIDKYQDVINVYNPEFSHIEQVKKFSLLHAEWGPIKEDGSDAELTPTLKLKRRVIREKYRAHIDNMYQG
ncbi:MAG: long-chain fatty acid--CoA ligase [Bacteroidota bacterium]